MKKSKYNYLVSRKENQSLLFNTRNHALIEVDDDTLKKYNNGTLDSEIVEAMSELGFLIENDVDELKEMQEDYEKFCVDHSRLELTVMTTERCNFRCPYCYQNHEAKDMTLEKAQTLCKFLKEIYKNETHTVDLSWFGGEPLLNPEPIFLVEKLLREWNFGGYSHITTNGYLLTDEMLERFRKETRIDSLQITLDGTTEQHNATRRHVSGKPTYEVICKNIQNAVAKGFYVTIRLNLNKENENIDPFLKELEQLRLDRTRYEIHITNAHNFEYSEKLKNFYYDTPEEFSEAYTKVQDSLIRANYRFQKNWTKDAGCSFERDNVFLVSCDLNLYLCTSCELSEYFKQGYIRIDGSLYLNENYRKRRELSVFKEEECRECIVLPMCMGACTYCRIKGARNCIPEKYFLDKYVERLYEEEKGVHNF